MPLTQKLRDKLQPEFLTALVAVGESLIAAKAPASVAYALRDELPFEAWPDDAIEAVARLVMELRRRFLAAEAPLQSVQTAAAENAPAAGNKGSKRDQGKHRGGNPQSKKPENPGSPPTEKGPTLPHGDKAA